jgi:hypothetical protein
MPKKRGPSKSQQTQLARLPHRPDLTILGGKRLLGMYLREGKEVFQPQVIIWLEEPSGMVRSSDVINPLEFQDGGISESLEALADTLIRPPPTPLPTGERLLGPPGKKGRGFIPAFQPGLPAKIIINDEPLAQAARELFAPLNVTVEYQQAIPAFDAAFQSLSQQLGASEDARPPEPFAWDQPLALLSPLYAAAAGFWRREPWAYLPDHPPLVITLGEQGPQPNAPTLYASILGGAGLAAGVAFYYSLESFERFLQRGMEMQASNPAIDQAIEMLRQSGVPVDQIPPDEVRMVLGQLLGGAGAEEGQGILDIMEEGMVCFFNPKEECDPTYLDWMAEHSLKPPSREGVPTFLKTMPGKEPQEPQDEREIKALTLALEALNQFFSHFRPMLEAPLTPNETLTHKARVGGATIVVSFTPTEDMYDDWLDEEELEEPDQPASASAPTTLYRFQVKLDWMKSVWRRIEMTGDQTLHDLHGIIQEAFDWDDDHLYAFFLSGKAWDKATAYESPHADGERSAAKYRLENLPLQPGQQFLYIFDFGDELRHQIKLEAIIPGGAKPGGSYPQITEQRGEAPPQYPPFDDE